jgi:hypothetical protein
MNDAAISQIHHGMRTAVMLFYLRDAATFIIGTTSPGIGKKVDENYGRGWRLCLCLCLWPSASGHNLFVWVSRRSLVALSPLPTTEPFRLPKNLTDFGRRIPQTDVPTLKSTFSNRNVIEE